MMNIQNPKILVPTNRTSRAKHSHNANLALPITPLMAAVIVFVPIAFLAIRRTKAIFGRGTTVFAKTALAPAMCMVAPHGTEFGRIGSASWNIECLATMETLKINSVFRAICRQSFVAFVPGGSGFTQSLVGFSRARSGTINLCLAGIKTRLAFWACVFHSKREYMEKGMNVKLAKQRIIEAQMQPTLEGM
jgi:hypothetical protein